MEGGGGRRGEMGVEWSMEGRVEWSMGGGGGWSGVWGGGRVEWSMGGGGWSGVWGGEGGVEYGGGEGGVEYGGGGWSGVWEREMKRKGSQEEEGMGGHVLVSFLECIVFFQNTCRFGNEVTYVKFACIFPS